MDLQKIKVLMQMVENSSIAEIEIRENSGSVRISKTSSVQQTITSSLPSTAKLESAPGATTQSSLDFPPEQLFTSPMVGIFHNSSSESDAPLVTIGQKVTPGTPLGIIESMKMLNMVESDREGVIKNVLVDNGQSVEFGQALFVIE